MNNTKLIPKQNLTNKKINAKLILNDRTINFDHIWYSNRKTNSEEKTL